MSIFECNSDYPTIAFNAGLVEKCWKCWKMLNSKHPQNWTSSWAAKVTQSGLRNVQSQDAGDRHHHRHRHHCRHLHIHCHHHKKKSNKDLGRSGLYQVPEVRKRKRERKVLVKSNNCVNVQDRCKEWKNVLHMFSFMAWRSWVVERRVTHKK